MRSIIAPPPRIYEFTKVFDFWVHDSSNPTDKAPHIK